MVFRENKSSTGCIGNLVEITAADLREDDQRKIGTVVDVDVYSRCSEKILECLWNTGEVGWILASRVEVVSENR